MSNLKRQKPKMINDEDQNQEPELEVTEAIDLVERTGTLIEPVDPRSKIDDGKPPPLSYTLSVNYYGAQTHLDQINTIDANALPDDDKSRTWEQANIAAILNGESDDTFLNSLNREDAEWSQGLRHNGKLIGAVKPKVANSTRGSGANAVLRATGVLGIGGVISKVLPHSGIWVTFKSPSDDDLLELDAMLANEKITLGRETGGLIFSHASAYMKYTLVSFALNHVTKHNVANVEIGDLHEHISVLDYQDLLIGLGIAIWTNGYNLSQPCIANVNKCNHVTHSLVHLAKLCWLDRTRLNEQQRSLLSARASSNPVESLEKYRDGMSNNAISGREIKLGDADDGTGLTILLDTPVLSADIAEGTGWVDDIVDTINDALTMDRDERNNFINTRAVMQSLCKYSSWIKSITTTTLDDNDELVEEVITCRTTILNTLKALSANDDIHDTIVKGIKTFISEINVSIIGIPNYRCRACNDVQTGEEVPTGIIPIKVQEVFTTLTRQRIAKLIATRKS